MIDAAWARTLARYNRWMNDKLYALCAELPDAERRRERGAFFGSIHGTLDHLVYGDLAILSRLTGDPAEVPPLGVELYRDFDALRPGSHGPALPARPGENANARRARLSRGADSPMGGAGPRSGRFAVAKAKGTALVGAVKFLRSQGERARGALPARLHHYLEERILPGTWYPEDDFLDLLRAVARLMPGAGDDVYAVMGRVTARDHMEDAYAHLFQGADDALTLPRKAFALWASMHDTGRLQVDMEGDGRARVELVGYALPCVEMCGIMTGYIEETFRLAGLGEPHLAKRTCRARGDDACVWSGRWSPSGQGG